MQRNTSATFAACLALIVGFAILTFYPRMAEADHRPIHRVLIKGIQSEIPIEFIICDTEGQIKHIFNTHRNVGFRAAQKVFEFYVRKLNHRRESTCAKTILRVTLLRVIDSADLVYPTKTTLTTIVEVRLPSGRVYYGKLSNFSFVEEKGQKT